MYKRQDHVHAAYHRCMVCCSPVDQLVMLYDGVISFVKQARVAIEQENWELRWNLIERASAVINGLKQALEGETSAAAALERFYTDVEYRLINIQCHNSLDVCDSVARDLKTVRDAWAEIAAGERANEENGTGDTVTASTAPHGEGKLAMLGSGLAISA